MLILILIIVIIKLSIITLIQIKNCIRSNNYKCIIDNDHKRISKQLKE